MARTLARDAKRNAALHDRIAEEYDARHGEIFNPIEQARLRDALKAAVRLVATRMDGRIRALDFGCGTGNITRHLLELGIEVTASDVSEKSLGVLAHRHARLGPLKTILLSDEDLASEQPEQFDFVATYSVLHHVPNYLRCVEHLYRVLRPGGVLFIDHEASPQWWEPSIELREFRAATDGRLSGFQKLMDPSRVLNPRWWYEKLRRSLDRRYSPEGDIHVWADDHIEWDRILDVLRGDGAEVVHVQDYLVFRAHHERSTYDRFAGRCADMRYLVARKPAGPMGRWPDESELQD